MIQIVYLVCETMLLNFFILKSTALLCNEKAPMLFVSVALSTMLSIIESMFVSTRIGRCLFLIGTAIWYICLSFKVFTFKKFLKLYLLYFLMVFCYGGLYYYISSFLLAGSHVVLILSSIVFFISVAILSKWLNKKKCVDNFCFEIQIQHNGKKVDCRAFLDSGNLLVDPNTNKPVSLVNFKIFRKLFGDEVNIEKLLCGKVSDCGINAYYIPFNTLNHEAKILVFEIEEITIKGRTEKSVELGLLYTNFGQAFGSDVILNNAFA